MSYDEIDLTVRPYDARELQAKPAWDLGEFSYMMGLPMSTLLMLLDNTAAPLFTLGRRKFILREDAHDWLSRMARENPHCKRTNQRRKGA